MSFQALNGRNVCRLEIGDTADWKSALRRSWYSGACVELRPVNSRCGKSDCRNFAALAFLRRQTSLIMPEDFPYDLFLSHSTKDKAVACPLAGRWQVAVRNHLKVWFETPSGRRNNKRRSRRAGRESVAGAQLESQTFRFAIR